MRRRVRIGPAAAQDLERLEAFLVDKNPTAAIAAIDAILDAIGSLTEFWDRGAPDAAPNTRNLFIPFGRAAYVVLYRVGTDEVLVYRIFHSLEDRPLA